MVPATVARMSADEQRALEAAISARAPISAITFVLPWVIDAMPEPEAAALLLELPLPMRLLYRALWRPSYARLAAPLALAEPVAA